MLCFGCKFPRSLLHSLQYAVYCKASNVGYFNPFITTDKKGVRCLNGIQYPFELLNLEQIQDLYTDHCIYKYIIFLLLQLYVHVRH
jgi:hypothetical protein